MRRHHTFRSDRRGTLGLLARRMAMGGAAWVFCAPAWAGPEGERVVAGSASFTRAGDLTTIRASNNTIINYQSFNIARPETVQFVQPSAASRVLNRITGADPTQIAGSLIANGIVYIVNPAGVYFRQGALVNVAQIYASAAHLADKDFARGVNRFTGVSGDVVNEGTINAGATAMVGQHVVNAGTINSPAGTVTMMAGNDVLVGQHGSSVYVRVGSVTPDVEGGSSARSEERRVGKECRL